MNQNKSQSTNLIPMISITILFFMWGFITSLNDILIPYFKGVYNLTHFEANIVQLAFFIAYFVGSLAMFFLAKIDKDPIHSMGYKKTLELGLYVAGTACAIFSIAATLNLGFGVFLIALFMLGIGLTFLQVAANPFVAMLGKEETASSRLNLSQAFNSLGTTLGPALGGYFIFKVFLENSVGAYAVRVPYLILAILLGVIAIFIHIIKIEEPKAEKKQEDKKDSIFKYTYVWLGAIGIFFYVGAEVAIGSNLVAYLTTVSKGSISESLASSYLSYYWGGAMIGRFLGAVSLSKIKTNLKILYMGLLAIVSFVLIYTINFYLHSLSIEVVWYFLIFMLLNFLFFYLGKGKPALLLGIFAIVNSFLLIIGMNVFGFEGIWWVWAVLAIGLFNSIMWSNIFTLAIDKLGDKTSQASSILIMMILGGAILPPLQGLVADLSHSITFSFIVPLVAYLYLIFYGLKGYSINKSE
ncbi:MAG: sugar MFS transporter [Bacteroidales bacterium]|nr:sugar MFS transporter [Bacteroidales bacterium]MDD4703008.1 sugar MFS transporter [Bacteroidales bacterium]MDX9797558.1 sugar MFS transporter [Bacteroidales bacterium]